jgi:hypothetical protein
MWWLAAWSGSAVAVGYGSGMAMDLVTVQMEM